MADLFDGATYDPALDEVRLTGQMRDVFECLKHRAWVSVTEIAKRTGHPENSVSAQIRNLRKRRFGAWEIQRYRHKSGLFLYLLTGKQTIPETKDVLVSQLRQEVARLERELAKCHGQGDLPL